MKTRIDAPTQQLLCSFAKIGILATEDESGYPHLTFLNSLSALGETRLTFGQFCAGLSKRFLVERPRAGFLALDADLRFVRGNATYTHSAATGPEFDRYNDIPMFRYNSYFGFSRVFYLDLDGVTKLDALDRNRIVLGAVLTRIAAPFCARSGRGALPHAAKALFAQLDGLKFLAYFNKSGAIKIIPIIQASHAGSDRIVFSTVPFGAELARVPDGAKAAVLCLNLDMECVLVKGVYHGMGGLIRHGIVDVERVYNAMPPKMEYVYPRSERIEPLSVF